MSGDAHNPAKLRGRQQFARYRAVIDLMVRVVGLFPASCTERLLVMFRRMGGIPGLVFRYVLLRNLAKSCGDNVAIYPDVYILGAKGLELGSNVSIHPMCYLDATGGISIGNDVSIAHGSTVMSTSHQYQSHDVPIRDQGLVKGRVVIEDNVWIGARSIILSGNTVGSGSIVGAGAVVTSDVPPNVIVGGVPAKKIKDR